MRANVYIDGFNLYYRALKDRRASDGSTYKWLDLSRLASALMPQPKYTIGRIRYFTALVNSLPDDPDAPVRQQAYLRALKTLPHVTIHLGYFMAKQTRARLVTPLADGTKAVKIHKTEEKGSDVNLATHLLLDGFREAYDIAAVITNDSDLVEPVRVVSELVSRDRRAEPSARQHSPGARFATEEIALEDWGPGPSNQSGSSPERHASDRRHKRARPAGFMRQLFSAAARWPSG